MEELEQTGLCTLEQADVMASTQEMGPAGLMMYVQQLEQVSSAHTTSGSPDVSMDPDRQLVTPVHNRPAL